jgi:shikimate dehydrogenase
MGNERATAPGQPTAREMREVYRIDQINPETAITGLIGCPVRHSISPDVHNAAFAERGMNAVYLPFEVHDSDAFLRRLIHPRSREIDWNLRGLSVTAPHKPRVLKHLDWIDPTASEIGAVNTIVVQGRELHGYNTDAEAFIEPLRRSLGSLKGLRCAIIGRGGAARAALWALRKDGAKLAFFVRHQKGSQQLAEEFGATCKTICEADFTGFDVIVNATPLGTRDQLEDETPVTAAQMVNVRLVYDLVYNPLETRFLYEARAAGCKTLAGLEMLVMQAAVQFKLWTDKAPDVEVMRAAAIDALSRESKH